MVRNRNTSPACEQVVKSASGSPRLKNVAWDRKRCPNFTTAPERSGRRSGRLSSNTGVMVRYLKKTSPKRASCGMIV